jgi:hypothetical protein
MEDTQKLKVILLGLKQDVLAIVKELLSQSELVEQTTSGETTQDAIKRLGGGDANCVFLDPRSFDSRDAVGLLQFCTQLFPVCLVAESTWLTSFSGLPRQWQERLRNYYHVRTDLSLPELRLGVAAAIQGCQYYLLKAVIRANLGQIVERADGIPASAVVDKARAAAQALTALDSGERRSLLRDSLGLDAEQMHSLFDETLSHARQTARRSEVANFVVLGTGVGLFVAMAVSALLRGVADPWSFAMSGTGAAAAITALVTSPGRRITSGASRSIFVQTAFFSFLTQVRILAPGSEPSMQRSQRLQEATTALMKDISAAIGPDS